MADDTPKIIVDDDWKAQAQAEKERLAQQVEKKPAASAVPATPGDAAAGTEPGTDAEGGERELPPASLTTLISSLVTQIYYALGGYEDPQTGRRFLDPGLAKHHIDTLAVLEQKTKGNLTDEERKLLDHALYETRMHYVQICERLSQM
ncbi:MAG: DUF1844 domain-containing protein [Phycisphaerae bacterium]|nr:DUF1844 domain-containing protein [Phycisphaerae bacterium]